jgi:predicted phage-related endonuclease
MSENYDQLVADAKAKLITGTPKATKENKNAVEAADPILANELLAERQSIADEIKLLTARKTAIEDIIKDAIGSKDELHIHGAKVATMSRWRETAVATDVVKENFPLLDYPELYKRSNKSRLTIH